MKDNLIIKSNLGYLNGFDGLHYEWTQDIKTAWHFAPKQGKPRLSLVKKQHPEARLHHTNGKEFVE